MHLEAGGYGGSVGRAQGQCSGEMDRYGYILKEELLKLADRLNIEGEEREEMGDLYLLGLNSRVIIVPTGWEKPGEEEFEGGMENSVGPRQSEIEFRLCDLTTGFQSYSGLLTDFGQIT